jgi:hypothetical protein
MQTKFDPVITGRVYTLAMRDKERRQSDDEKDVLREEKQRGASRHAVSQQKERQLVRDLHELLQIADEREYIAAIKKRFPINESSARFEEVLQIWREQHGVGRRRG